MQKSIEAHQNVYVYSVFVFIYFLFLLLLGKDGIEGKNAPKPGFHFFGGNFGGFDSSSSVGASAIPPFITVNYEIKGNNGKKPSKGGDGGCGGFGGHKGETYVVVLKKPPQFSIVDQKGVYL